MSEKITLPVEFEIGTLDEVAAFVLKQQWIDAERDGIEYNLTCGAGLGNPLIECSAKRGDDSVYAKADIRHLAQALFDALTARLS